MQGSLNMIVLNLKKKNNSKLIKAIYFEFSKHLIGT